MLLRASSLYSLFHLVKFTTSEITVGASSSRKFNRTQHFKAKGDSPFMANALVCHNAPSSSFPETLCSTTEINTETTCVYTTKTNILYHVKLSFCPSK